MGGPFDGEGIGGWRYEHDTYEVFLRYEPARVHGGRPLRRTHGAWASDLRERRAAGDVHLGSDRLDFPVGQATWVPV
jgi:hypothetical protein